MTDQFVHRQNLEHFRKLLAETTDVEKRKQLLMLLSEEEAKKVPPAESK